jgi:hypothetical protein
MFIKKLFRKERQLSKAGSETKMRQNEERSKFRREGKGKAKWLVWAAVGLVVVLAGLVVRGRLAKKVVGDQTPEVITTQVGRSFEFTALNPKGEKADADGNEYKVVMGIPTAEKTDQVLIKGQPASAKGEKTFLVLNLEIDNASTEKRYIAPVNLIRLVNDQGRMFAPDVHSDMVEIQPISTKISRVGFVVLKSQKKFLIKVGELDGEKQDLEITFDK